MALERVFLAFGTTVIAFLNCFNQVFLLRGFFPVYYFKSGFKFRWGVLFAGNPDGSVRLIQYIDSLNRTKLLMQNFAFPFKFQLVLVDLGSQRKNMALKNFDFVRGRRYRRFKNDDFQIDPSISRDRVIFRIGTYYWIFLALMRAFEWWVERQPIRKFVKKFNLFGPPFLPSQLLLKSAKSDFLLFTGFQLRSLRWDMSQEGGKVGH